MDQNKILDRLDRNMKRGSALETLLQVDEVLDSLNVYAYENWIEGEIVDGPGIERYWVTVTLMYPYKLMPNPEGAQRIIDAGGKVYYAQDEFITAAKIKQPEDMVDTQDSANGQPRAKKVVRKVWLVTLELPRQFMDSMATSQVKVDDMDIDTDSVEQAYDDGMGDDDAFRS